MMGEIVDAREGDGKSSGAVALGEGGGAYGTEVGEGGTSPSSP